MFLGKRTGMRIEAQSFSYSLLTLSAELSQVELKTVAPGDPVPFLKADKVRAGVSLLSLLRGKPVISDAKIEGLRIRIDVNAEGRNNLPRTPSSGNNTAVKEVRGLPLPVLIRDLRADRASFLYSNPRQGVEIELPSWSLDIHGISSKWSQSVRFLTKRQGKIAIRNRLLPVKKLNLGFELGPEKLHLENLQLELGESRLLADGTLEDFASPEVNSSVEAEVDIGSVLQLSGLARSATGKLSITTSITGPAAQAVAYSQISGRNISFGNFHNMDLSASLTWEEAQGCTRIDALKIDSPQGSVSVQAKLACTKKPGVSSAEARLENLDLETVARRWLPVHIASRARGNISAQWQGMDPATFRIHSDLQLNRSLTSPAKDVLPVTAAVKADFAGDRLKIRLEQGRILNLDIRGDLSLVAWKKPSGRIRAETGNMADCIHALEKLLGRPPDALLGTSPKGPLEADATLGGTLDALHISGVVRAPDTIIGNIRHLNAQTKVSYTPGRVALRETEAEWQNQSLAGEGSIEFGSRQSRLNFTANVREGSLQAIVAGLGKDWPLEGRYNLKAEAGGSLEDIRLSAEISLAGLRAYGQDLGSVDLSAGIDGKQIKLERLELIQPGEGKEPGRLSSAGTYNLATNSYILQANAKSIAFDSRASHIPKFPETKGILNFALSGSGTLDNPSGRAEMQLSDLEIDGRRLDSLDVAAQLERHRASAVLRLPRYGIVSNADMEILSPYSSRLQIAVDTDLSGFDIRLLQGEALNGHITATLQAVGDLARWEDSKVSVRATDLRATIRGTEIRSRGPIEMDYEKGRLPNCSVNLISGNSHISLHGSLPAGAQSSPDSITIDGNLDLADFAPFMQDMQISAGGIVKLNGKLRGSIRRLEPDIEFTVSNGRFNHPIFRSPMQDIDLRAIYSQGNLKIVSFVSRMGSGSIRAEGTLPLTATRDFSISEENPAVIPTRFTADVRDFDIADLSFLPRSVTGTIGFHFEGETPDLKNLDALRAKLLFNQFAIRSADYELYQAAPVQLSIANGIVTLDHFLLNAPTTRILANGSLGLTGDRPINIQAKGEMDIGAAALLSGHFKASGDSRFQFDLKGTLSEPKASGFFEVHEGIFSMESPRLSATDLNIRILVDPESMRIESFSGILNGGELNIEGSTKFTASGLEDMKFDATLTDAFFNYPDGFRTQTSGKITLQSQEEFMALGGRILVQEGAYRKRVDLVRELLTRLQSNKITQFTEEKNPFLSRLRFNLNIETPNGIAIDTNLATLTANADLRLTGNYYRNGLVGRITLAEGGQIRFHERTYLVEKGVISFVNETEIEPQPDILATTRVANHDISLKLTGTLKDLKANLTSDPPLSQPDIIALLLTGRELENLQGSGLNVAREQVESYLSGQMADFLSRNAKEAIGLSLVRIDPSLISPEANPGARLTIGNDITDSLFLIYSMNLVDAGDRILSVKYDITRNFQTEMTRQSDNSYRFELGQNISFGAPKESSGGHRTAKKKIGIIAFTGNPGFSREQLQDRFGVKSGDTYDFLRIQKGLDRLDSLYTDRDYLEKRILIKKAERDKAVDLTLHIETGPVVEMRYRGWTPSGGVKDRVLSAWAQGFFDEQRIQDAKQEIWSSLAKEGYLKAAIQSEVQSVSPDKKIVAFSVDTGIRFHNVGIEFSGASGIEPSRLKKALEKEKLVREIHTAPEETVDFLKKYYRLHGFLDVRIQNPQYRLNPETATGKVVIPIQEGPLFRIHKLEFKGNSALPLPEIMAQTSLAPGGIYNPDLVAEAADRLEKLYWTRGYNNVVIDYTLKRSEEVGGTVDILFRITENSSQYVKEIEVDGNRKTSKAMILSQITLKPGDILDYREINKSRSHLYDTRAYTLVDLQSKPLSGPQPPGESSRQPVQLKVTVKETSPFRLVYSGFYDTERGGGGIADFSNRNSLGSARLIGTRGRFDADVQEIRGYFSQPFLRTFPINTDLTAYFRRETLNSSDITNTGFSTDRTGFSLQQEVQFRNQFILNYGYRFEHKKQREIASGEVTIQNTAPLTVAVTRDSRMNLLDSWKGSMLSQAFEYAPSYLGSDLRYYKYFGQYFYYLPLSESTRIPWVGENRSRLVLAAGIRAGLAGGFDGQDLIESDKFFSGGGTTIRGFGQNEVGPKGIEGNPIGGNALFIINGEIRFPVFSIFDGVGFLDLGNVYPKATDFDPTNVRSSAGLGLRVRTPYFLLRADYGLKLDRQPGESRGKLFFSIGQAF